MLEHARSSEQGKIWRILRQKAEGSNNNKEKIKKNSIYTYTHKYIYVVD